ncbi:MAG: serine protease, partial [Candidatus Omnitrophica bacterium]|nr:serine protease [Candidatus Omnitrophota bacterium]
QPKKNIYLKKAAPDVMKGLQFPVAQLKSKIKLTPSEISTRCAPAVVSIKTKKKNGEVLGIGSGFLVSSNGFIVTNMHVLESAYTAEIKIGEVIFKDAYFVNAIPEADIALIKVEAENLPYLPIGNSDTLMNGQPLVVLGNPWGLDKSVSDGLVSAVRTKGDITLIQMTAPVSPGSSGGPVINEQGEAVGITTIASFFITQNLNFAIPINYIQKLIKN